jgi:hypothetical protein
VPEQVAQSGWQAVHVPAAVMVLEGQEETHLPPEASWPPLHVRQKSAAPTHVPHWEEHAVAVLSTDIGNEKKEFYRCKSSCLLGKQRFQMGNFRHRYHSTVRNQEDIPCTVTD